MLENQLCVHLDRLALISGAPTIGKLAEIHPHVAYLHIYQSWHGHRKIGTMALDYYDADLGIKPVTFKNSRSQDVSAIETVMTETLPPILTIEEPFWLVVSSFQNQSTFDKLRRRQAAEPLIKASFLVEPFYS